MEFIDDDARPRFLFHSRSSDSSPLPETAKISKLHAASCLFSSATLFITAFLLSSNSILFSLLIWISLSLLLAPFAPLHTTGGDPHVGRGDPLPPPLPKPSDPDEPRRRPASRWNPKPNTPSSVPAGSPISKPDEKRGVNSVTKEANREEEWSIEDFEILKRRISKHPAGSLISKPDEKRGVNPGESVTKEANREVEWSIEDFEILKRQILKHPVGAPGRWERVAEAFKGRHGVESVIHAAKSLAERRSTGDDSFALFLKQRKPLEKQVDAVNADCSVSGSVGWSSGEDIALLNALKAFPKDAAMRWEKVAAAVPGKSKAECMKRVAELKRDFRSSKTS